MRKRSKQKGIGLYTYDQSRDTSGFQYFAQVVVGAVVTAAGLALLCYRIGIRREEFRSHATGGHLWQWVTTSALIAIGLFQAHAGIIFYG